MPTVILINLSYTVAAVLFILGLKFLGNPDTARRGNALSSLGMLLAVVVTLLDCSFTKPTRSLHTADYLHVDYDWRGDLFRKSGRLGKT